jgi:transcriptional regulator with XRE-family HTH domain
MAKYRRAEISAEATRRNFEQLARLGGQFKQGRLAHRKTQADVAAAAGIGRSTVSAIERGRGGGHTLDTWQRLALAVERPLRVELDRDRSGSVADTVHLAIQELVLGEATLAGWGGTVELQLASGQGRQSVDIALRHDRHRVLALIECWNTLDDIGAAARSFDWKRRRAEDAAVALGHGESYRVGGCWVVRATQRNRALVQRYPQVFASRFPGSSLGWIRALTTGVPPPEGIGLVWVDVAISRLYAWRH